MRSINHGRLEPYISAPRLNTYRAFFTPANDVELLGCYLWSKEVASAFFPLLQVLEITLRNAIHKEAHQATSEEQALEFFTSLGPQASMMIKAIAGGGGRGMSPVTDLSQVEHTIIEEVFAVDLVQAQIQVAAGHSRK